jgi:hypothetical protein
MSNMTDLMSTMLQGRSQYKPVVCGKGPVNLDACVARLVTQQKRPIPVSTVTVHLESSIAL